MTKDKLKTGQLIECRNGRMYIVMLHGTVCRFDDMAISQDGWIYFENMTEDLRNKNNDDFDVIRVWDIPNTAMPMKSLFDTYYRDCIWVAKRY